mmetsp:Transcript_13844/g.34813  ORF Transcript_13844/g.34813 Transcript_13844/m.34813 type:complete len:270 (-) Transcript_13844:252-1061(-)
MAAPAMAFMVEGAKGTFAKAKDVSTNLIKTSKPWKEFIDRSSFSKVSFCEARPLDRTARRNLARNSLRPSLSLSSHVQFSQYTDAFLLICLPTRARLPLFSSRNVTTPPHQPDGITNAVGRVRKNVAYFGVNYLILMLLTVAGFLISKPSSIVWLLVLSSLWLYIMAVNPGPMTIGGRTFSQMEKLIGTSVFTVAAIFYFSSVGTVLLYAALSGVGLIAVHGSFRTPENLFSDDGPGGGELPSGNFASAFSTAFSGLMKPTSVPVESVV